jgi:penicillin-insensitive murein endopeptidase
MRRYFFGALALFLFSGFCFGNEWSRMETPTLGVAKSIGSISSGCIAGAATLPEKGPGYEVMHLERNRYFGHPELVKTIEMIGRTVEREKLGILHVGDLAQPRGGPMPSSHASHQSGIDVDIWFALDPALTKNADAKRSDVPASSFTNETGTKLNHSFWKKENARVLEFSASLPTVDRIFVNPQIKNDLCHTVLTNDRAWLRKIRPWWGHADHLHMRLVCPVDSPECKPQTPLPSGDGCGPPLDWWLRLKNTMPGQNANPPRVAPSPRLPRSCHKLLSDK